jgi:hypothetical protein
MQQPGGPDLRGAVAGVTRWRLAAIVAASLVPAAMDVTRSLGHGKAVDVRAALVTTTGVLVLLLALLATFDFATRRRVTGARCFALTGAVAVAVSVAEFLAAAVLSDALGLELVEPAHRSALVATRMGVANGVLGLGLFAMAVALPLAASGAREAERLRVAAELARLRANLQPHFLFNTLSTVSGLVGEDPREARRLIGALGDLLRDSLVEADDMRTLDEEIAWLKHYADILETRHRGSISFRWEIDEQARHLRIPRLLLQPLVENAVKHGALRRAEGGEVSVRATAGPAGGGRLTCVIEDNGPGPLAGAQRSGALGIDLVMRRLSLRYGRAAEFRLESGEGRTRSVVALPAEPAP